MGVGLSPGCGCCVDVSSSSSSSSISSSVPDPCNCAGLSAFAMYFKFDYFVDSISRSVTTASHDCPPVVNYDEVVFGNFFARAGTFVVELSPNADCSDWTFPSAVSGLPSVPDFSVTLRNGGVDVCTPGSSAGTQPAAVFVGPFTGPPFSSYYEIDFEAQTLGYTRQRFIPGSRKMCGSPIDPVFDITTALIDNYQWVGTTSTGNTIGEARFWIDRIAL